MSTPSVKFLDSPALPTGITRFWLIRHALVEENARTQLYGALDVPLCPYALQTQRPVYEALAKRLPKGALWFSSPLSRAKCTAQTIQQSGYGPAPVEEEAGIIEQSLGEWQGLRHEKLPERLKHPPHLFWPTSATECPPSGESMVDVCARVGRTLDRLSCAHQGKDMVLLSHGGAIRAALAHALRLHAEQTLHFAIQNLSLTILEHHEHGWRVVCVNALLGI